VVSALVAVIVLGALDAEAARRKRRKRRAKKGIIQVLSPVAGASVYLDGKLWGTTPLSPLRISPRVYRVTVKKLGFLEFEKPLAVKAGLKSTLEAKLLPAAGVLDIKAGVPARVLVDGVDRGETPLRLELPVGEHEVVVVAGSREERKMVRAVAGEEVAMGAFGDSSDLGLALTPLDQTPPEPEIALVPPSKLPDEGLPLELGPQPAPDKGLDLELPTAENPDQALELEALPLDLPPDSELAAVDPLNPDGIEATAADDKEWYQEWWALTAGGAILVGAVATSIALSSGGGSDTEYQPDVTLVTGD
ncbi:MAG: PEGA domain-containing protein, partial [Myxococcota bacterium]